MHIQQRASPETDTQGLKLAPKNSPGAAYFLTSANVAVQEVLACSNNGMNHFLAILRGLFMGPASLVLQGA